MQCDVSYIDTIDGGSGSTRVPLEELPYWLAANKGYLIREIIPVSSIAIEEGWKISSRHGWDNLRKKINSRI